MWGLFDFLTDILLFEMIERILDRLPRPLRIGCVTLLFAFVALILIWALWPRK